MIPLSGTVKTKHFSWIRWLLIALNVYVFWIELHLKGPALQTFIFHWGVVPKLLFKAPLQHAYTLVTATFVHGGWLHILFNMLFFYIFSNNVEDHMGHIKFLIFYLTVGVVANLAQAYMMPHEALPLIGASGAIAGVLGAYFFYFPHSKIVTLIPIVFFITIREVPAFIFLGLWFLSQMFNGTAHLGIQATNGSVAWWAHAGGFIAGILLAPLFSTKTSANR
jgi:membrane associated rhomboid family serine protease